MADLIRRWILSWLWPTMSKDIDSSIRTHLHNFYAQYEDDKKLQRAHLGQATSWIQEMGARENVEKERHEEHMAILKEISSALNRAGA